MPGETTTLDIPYALEADSPPSVPDITKAMADHLEDIEWPTASVEDKAVTTAKLDDKAATTAKINDAAVTAAKLGTMPRCRVYRTALQELEKGNTLVQEYTAERYDTDTMHSTSSNKDRVTITTSGHYHVFAGVKASGSGLIRCRLLVSGGGEIAGDHLEVSTDAVETTLSSCLSLTAGEYLTLELKVLQGTTVNILPSTAGVGNAADMKADFGATFLSA